MNNRECLGFTSVSKEAYEKIVNDESVPSFSLRAMGSIKNGKIKKMPMLLTYDYGMYPSYLYEKKMKYYKKYWKKHKWTEKRIKKYFYKYLN